MKRLHVLMLPKWFPNAIDNAEGNYVQRHISAISKFCDVTVLYVHSKERNLLSFHDITINRENGYEVITVYFKRFNSGLLFPDKCVNFFRFIRSQIKGYRIYREKNGIPDLIHVHSMTRTCVLAYFLKSFKNIPFVISEHWSGYLSERKIVHSFLKRKISVILSAKANCITCVSSVLKQGMKKYGYKNEIIVIPNVVDIMEFYPEKSSLYGNRIRIVHISRLDSHTKNCPGILRAFRSAVEQNNFLELHLFGDGVEKEKQVAYATELGLLEKVFFYGYRSSTEIAEALRKSNFLIVFSNYESQSCAIIESFACGIPVIATSVGGIPEMMNNERGILVKKGDEAGLSRAILMMAADREKYDVGIISGFARQRFSTDVIGKKFEQLYRRAIGVSDSD